MKLSLSNEWTLSNEINIQRLNSQNQRLFNPLITTPNYRIFLHNKRNTPAHQMAQYWINWPINKNPMIQCSNSVPTNSGIL